MIGRPRLPSANDLRFTRRRMFQIAGRDVFGLAMASWMLLDQSEAAEAVSAVEPLNRFPRMMQNYFVERVRQAEMMGEQRRAALKSKEDAEAYVGWAREKIRESFGPFPERTPLNPRITGTVDRDTYAIENVIFESRPGFLVTANLYLPKGRRRPLPGVVGTCGHSVNGKCAEAYQSFAQGLARMGYVVLIYDPISQGERLQYTDEKLKSPIGPGVAEHLYEGNPQFLVDEFLGTWRAWDGIRALDYLLTREEVDPNWVGVTGNSGGGTMSTWLCGVEQRWAAGAPSCFVTTLRRNLENELPADTEQCPPRALALGLDHSDFLAALAPRPVIILAKEKDFFDVRGSEEAYQRLKRLYRLLGAEDNIALFVGPTEHGYTQENREAMYRWFNRASKISDAASEPQLTIEKDETLWCTPHGQVAELGSRPLWTFTRDASQDLAKRRPKLEGDALKKAVAQTLKLPPRGAAPEYRVLRPIGGRKYPKPGFATYAVDTEPGVFALVYMLDDKARASRPPQDFRRAVLYVAHQSSDAELRDEPLVHELLQAEPESLFCTCDVRGIGESRPNTCGTDTFLKPYGADYFYAIHSIMLDYPYVGQRTHDVLRVLDWLKAQGIEQVHLAGKGWGALPATFAALVSDRVAQVTLKNALTCYAAIAESERYQWPLSAMTLGALKTFDLPDCYRALETTGLRQIEPWGAEAGEP